jgi:hypothetical protein
VSLEIFKRKQRLVNLSFYYRMLEIKQNYSDVIQKYRFPSDILLDFIYSKFIQIDERSVSHALPPNLNIDYDYDRKRKYTYYVQPKILQ